MNEAPIKSAKSDSPEFVYVWNYLEWGGAQVLFFGLIEEAKKIGRVHIVLPHGSNSQLLKFLQNLDVKISFVDSHFSKKTDGKFFGKLKMHLDKLISEVKFCRHIGKMNLQNAVLHTEFAPWESMLTLLWLARRNPVFVTMHNSLPVLQKWRSVLIRWKFKTLARAKKFHLFTANEDTKKSLAPLVPQSFFDTIKIIYANVNPAEVETALEAEIDKKSYCARYKIPADKFLVFCVGQFIDRKGRWIFLEAARKLLEKNGDIAFVWISNSKPAAADLEKAAGYGLGENFTFLTSDQIGGEHTDLFKLLRLADVFALPSYVEGLPISIVESLALGIPTISTRINAIPEAVKHLETGILIEPGDSSALQEVVQMLKDNPDLREKLAVAGRRFALEKFNQKEVAKIAVGEYLRALRSEREKL